MIKRLSLVFAVITLLFACQSTEKNSGYVVDGSAKEVYNGIRIYLNTMDSRGQLVPIDTAIVMNEKFKFDGALRHPKMVYLTANSISGRLPFMLENSNLEISVDKSNLSNTIISGSKNHDLYLEYTTGMKDLQNQIRLQNQKYRKAVFDKDSTSMMIELENLKAGQEKSQDFTYAFMENHPSSYVSLELFEAQSKQRQKDDQRLLEIFDNFDQSLKQSIKGIKLGNQVNLLKQSFEANKKLQIGAVAPNFSGPNPDGELLSLEEIVANGKVTIIDFWAAWCGPCRRENPNVVRIYNKYHDLGLNIVGVSLDGQTRQRDPKKAWIQAIEKDNLTWNHVSNLKYFKDPIAQLYNINAIPATFILDAEGRIVAKNLRGQALELKVKELLEN